MVQWLWYYYNDLKDQEEDHVRSRNLVEYHASFIEPDIVNKIIEQRESGGEGVIGTTDDEAFRKSVGEIFGRDVKLPSSEEHSDGEIHEVSGLLDRVKAYDEEQAALKKETLPFNFKHWSEFNLE